MAEGILKAARNTATSNDIGVEIDEPTMNEIRALKPGDRIRIKGTITTAGAGVAKQRYAQLELPTAGGPYTFADVEVEGVAGHKAVKVGDSIHVTVGKVEDAESGFLEQS